MGFYGLDSRPLVLLGPSIGDAGVKFRVWGLGFRVYKQAARVQTVNATQNRMHWRMQKKPTKIQVRTIVTVIENEDKSK